MKTIWKFPLEAKVMQRVFMPSGAQILNVREQGNTICLWAEVQTENKTEERVIEVFPTGSSIQTGVARSYLGSAHINNGELVFHVYEQWG